MTTPVALMSCMRNEGIHIVEWLAYHRVIGFDPVIVCTNDCTDGSDQLLDRLAESGAVHHLPNPVPKGEPVQDFGTRRVFEHLARTDIDWLAHLDSDEFLNIAPGAAPVQEIVAKAGAAHAIALPWLSFGDGGHATWPGATLPHFTACEAAISPDTVKFKSIHRFRAFKHASEHMPTSPRINAPRAVNAAGEELSPAPLLGKPRARYQPVETAMRGGAVVNHYAVRSTDTYLLKNDRGFAPGGDHGKYHLNSPWYLQTNRNDRPETSILRRWPEVQAEMARLRALPGVAAAEAACQAWFQDRSARILTPETIRKWTKGAAP
jgi:Glycosyl transferase family 2